MDVLCCKFTKILYSCYLILAWVFLNAHSGLTLAIQMINKLPCFDVGFAGILPLEVLVGPNGSPYFK